MTSRIAAVDNTSFSVKLLSIRSAAVVMSDLSRIVAGNLCAVEWPLVNLQLRALIWH